MALNAEQLALLLQSIASFSATLKDKLDGKLAIDGTAADSAKLGGQTLEEILANLDAASKTELAAVVADFEAFMARTDNPHAVTKEQVGLGLVENFGIATDEEAVAGTAADKYLTAKNLGAFWADKIGAAPETLDTIHEIAAALQNNPDVIASLETLVGENKAALDALTAVVAAKLDATADLGANPVQLASDTSVVDQEVTTVALTDTFVDGMTVRATRSEGVDTIEQFVDGAWVAASTLSEAELAAVSAALDAIPAVDGTAYYGGEFVTETVPTEVTVPASSLKTHLETLNGKVSALEASVADSAEALEGKLDKSAKASAADVDAGVEDEKYITPLALQPKLAALSLATDTNTASIEDLVAQMTAAFNDAAASMDPVVEEPVEPEAGV